MKTIKCFGNFAYTKYKVVSIVKILRCKENSNFTVGSYYPVIFNFKTKSYSIMDNDYNIDSCYYYNENIRSIYQFLIEFNDCIFEVLDDFIYIVDNKKRSFGRNDKKAFNIDWKFIVRRK